MILEGEMNTDMLDTLAQELLNHMKRKASLDTIDGILTTAECEGKIKTWPEQISTSPSGFDLTQSKALILAHNKPLKSAEGKASEVERLT